MTVHLNSAQAPLLIAVHDGFPDGQGKDPTGAPLNWQSVSPDLAVTFKVKGPYSITVVCHRTADDSILVWQTSRTLQDDTTKDMPEPTLSTPCAPDPATHSVSGTLAQAGTVYLGGSTEGSVAVATAGGAFTFTGVTDGTYFLAATADPADPTANVTVKPITVHGADLSAVALSAATPPASITLGIDNPPAKTSKEKITAMVEVAPKGGAVPTPIFVSPALDLTVRGTPQMPLNPSAKTPALSGTGLIADEDTQSAVIVGDFAQRDGVTGDQPIAEERVTHFTTHRLATQLFSKSTDKITDGSTPGNGITVPGAITAPAPALDTTNRLGVALPVLPTFDDVTITTTVPSSASKVTYQQNITTNYFTGTLLAHPVFDTNIPNFNPAWQLDFTQEYNVDIVTEHDVKNDDDVVIGHQTSEYHGVVTTMKVPAPE